MSENAGSSSARHGARHAATGSGGARVPRRGGRSTGGTHFAGATTNHYQNYGVGHDYDSDGMAEQAAPRPVLDPAATGSFRRIDASMGAKVEIGTGGDMGDHMNMMMSVLDMVETPWLNRAGKRFCNEAFGVPFVAGCQSARQPIGSEIIQVWDDGHWRAFAENQALGHFNASDISDAKMDEYAAKLEEAKLRDHRKDRTSVV